MGKTTPAQKNPVGRPTIYIPDYHNEAAYKLCLLGAIDDEMADFFEINVSTLNLWKEKHSEFMESIREGKLKADAEVAKSLYHRALGYTHPEEKIFNHNGEILRAETTKQYPPDTAAIRLWLINRGKGRWADKQEIDSTLKATVIMPTITKDGKPMEFNVGD